jgi:hypothetical protein
VLKPTSRRGLTFADAVQLLGAGDTPFIAMLGRVAGAGAGVTAAATLSSVDLLAVRNEVVEQGERAARLLRERQAGLSRFDRTQRIAAAHTVLVVSSYFEVFDEVAAAFGLDAARFEINLTEQVALGAGTVAEVEREGIVRALTDNDVPMPTAGVPAEALADDLRRYYRSLTTRVLDFATDLAIGERIRVAEQQPWDHAVEAALRRYRIAFRSLAAEVPEFAIWAAMLDAEAGRATTERVGADLGTGLAGIHDLLERLRTGDAAAHRFDLAEQYRRRLDQAVLDTVALPDGVHLPTIGDLYVNPRARLRRAEANAQIGNDGWWAEALEVADLQPSLAAHLTGPDAVTAPLVVLGQPGSGKSMLSRVLAGRLPAEEFLPVRVELRKVAVGAPLQDQIESAVYDALGERVTWPDLVRAAGGALPVVILDGFDELLQASGVNQAHYLEEVREFQRREADRNRPVAVLVTSRSSVADRARVPEGSLVLRLEPFDDEQVRCWLRVWAAANTAGLAGRSLRPLTAEAALHYRELAGQPLLLLLLALYDAGDNALQRAAAGLDEADLYERLFTEFARREIIKRTPAIPADGERAAIAKEIYCLELVAFAMFARGAQLITEADLDADLAILLRDEPIHHPRWGQDHPPLTAAQLMAGRFFFVQESQASPGVDLPERTFEFLHATFGEFLVARLVIGALVRFRDEREFQDRQLRPGSADVGPLYAWLSFAVLTEREPIIRFCGAVLGGLDAAVRADCRALLLKLLQEAAFPQPNRSLIGYRPAHLSETERHAAFSANIVLLLVLLSPAGIKKRELFPDHSWRSHALLWESQLLGSGWQSLWQTLRVISRRLDEADPPPDGSYSFTAEGQLQLEDSRPVNMHESAPFDFVTTSRIDGPWENPFRDLTVPADSEVGIWLRETAFRETEDLTAVLVHGVAPYWRHIATEHFMEIDSYPVGVDMAALLDCLLLPRASVAIAERRLLSAYLSCLNLFGDNNSVQAVLMRNLEADASRMGPNLVLAVLKRAVATGFGVEHNYWTAHLDVVAGLLVTAQAMNGGPEAIREIWELVDGVISMVNQPGQLPFGSYLERAFAQHGLEIPEEIRPR